MNMDDNINKMREVRTQMMKQGHTFILSIDEVERIMRYNEQQLDKHTQKKYYGNGCQNCEQPYSYCLCEPSEDE